MRRTKTSTARDSAAVPAPQKAKLATTVPATGKTRL
jgi:hypothetical protein